MNAIYKQQLSRPHSQISIAFDFKAEAPHVFVSEAEAKSHSAKASGSKNNFIRLVVGYVAIFVSWLAWLAQASVVRSVAPGARSEQRHEFENLDSRRGGFGNVF